MVQRSIWWEWKFNIEDVAATQWFCDANHRANIRLLIFPFLGRNFLCNWCKAIYRFFLQLGLAMISCVRCTMDIFVYCILFINFEFHASNTFRKVLAKEFRYAEKWVRLNDIITKIDCLALHTSFDKIWCHWMETIGNQSDHSVHILFDVRPRLKKEIKTIAI